MKKFFRKICLLIVATFMVTALWSMNFAHSGRTDSSGGHRDNKNKSGLGSYHYHCGGYPAHLHTNGVCPYSKPVIKEEVIEPEKEVNEIINEPVVKEETLNTNETLQEVKVDEVVEKENITEEKTIIEKEPVVEEKTIVEEETVVQEVISEELQEKEIPKVDKNLNEEEEIFEKQESSGEAAELDNENETAEELNEMNVVETNDEEMSAVTLETTEEQNITDSTDSGSLIGVLLLGGAAYLGYKKIKK